jgi:hypothetical protein
MIRVAVIVPYLNVDKARLTKSRIRTLSMGKNIEALAGWVMQVSGELTAPWVGRWLLGLIHAGNEWWTADSPDLRRLTSMLQSKQGAINRGASETSLDVLDSGGIVMRVRVMPVGDL